MEGEPIDIEALLGRLEDRQEQEARVARVQKMLQPMHVPVFRRDLTRPANVRWLIRNLRVNNGKRVGLKPLLRELVELQKRGE